MIEFKIQYKKNNRTIATVINIHHIRWIDLWVNEKELKIWIVGNDYPICLTNEILVDCQIDDIYKRIRLLMKQ